MLVVQIFILASDQGKSDHGDALLKHLHQPHLPITLNTKMFIQIRTLMKDNVLITCKCV
jgi:hypothetical protein